jgi:hypothetical protein
VTIKKVTEVVGEVIEYWKLVLTEKRSIEQLTRGFTTNRPFRLGMEDYRLCMQGSIGNPEGIEKKTEGGKHSEEIQEKNTTEKSTNNREDTESSKREQRTEVWMH